MRFAPSTGVIAQKLAFKSRKWLRVSYMLYKTPWTGTKPKPSRQAHNIFHKMYVKTIKQMKILQCTLRKVCKVKNNLIRCKYHLKPKYTNNLNHTVIFVATICAFVTFTRNLYLKQKAGAINILRRLFQNHNLNVGCWGGLL